MAQNVDLFDALKYILRSLFLEDSLVTDNNNDDDFLLIMAIADQPDLRWFYSHSRLLQAVFEFTQNLINTP